MTTGVAMSLVLFGVPAQGSDGTQDLLDTLTVFADDQTPVTSKFDLVAEQEYMLVFTGTGAYTNAGVDFENDAIWCYKSTFPEGYCAPDSLNDPEFVVNCLEFRIGDEEFQQSTLPGRFDGGPAPAYNDAHRYEWTFVAHRSGALAYRDRCDTEDATGTYRIEIHGDQPGEPAPPPGTPPPNETTVSEPDPGSSVAVSSPDPLPRKGGEVTVGVTSSAGDLTGTTIVGEGEVEVKKSHKRKKAFEVFLTCLFMGPKSVFLTEEEMDRARPVVNAELARVVSGGRAPNDVESCMIFLRAVLGTAEATPRLEAPAAESTCGVQRVPLVLKIRKGKLTKVKEGGGGASAPRYSCTGDEAALQITATHGRKASLRDSLGKKLDLGVVRAPDAVDRDATLTFGFS